MSNFHVSHACLLDPAKRIRVNLRTQSIEYDVFVIRKTVLKRSFLTADLIGTPSNPTVTEHICIIDELADLMQFAPADIALPHHSNSPTLRQAMTGRENPGQIPVHCLWN